MSTVGAPAPRFAAAATAYEGKYLVAGGCTSYDLNAPAEITASIYDPATDTWSEFPSFDIEDRRNLSVLFTVPDGLYSLGGETQCRHAGISSYHTLVKYDPIGLKWDRLPYEEDTINAGYNKSITVIPGTNEIFIYGGGGGNGPAWWYADRGSFPLLEDTWLSWTHPGCPLSGCIRGGAFTTFYDAGFIRVMGGDPTYGTAPAGLSFELATSTWSNWTVPAGTPDFQNDFSNYSNTAPTGVDTGTRLMYVSETGNVAIYDRALGTWSTDVTAPPSGFCAGGSAAYVDGELVVYSGSCDGVLASVGARYQAPAPGLAFTPTVSVTSTSTTFTVGEVTRLVTFNDPFGIDETEVTAAQYQECVTASSCTAAATGGACTSGVSGLEQHPINCVTYAQSGAYCSWAGKRLPTQQEWEYAARHNDPTTHKYPWGNSTADYNTKCNFSVTTDGYVATAPVGSFPAGNSALGLQDMAGNVWEWTSSPACFNETGDCTNCPAGGCASACDVCGSPDRVFKGGGFTHALAYTRSAFRSYNDPSYSTDILGFRCAKNTVVP
jgi:formylglycine-generating enzyme required for sulfatase activity